MKTIHTNYILKRMNGDDWESPSEGKITIGYLIYSVLAGRTLNPQLAWDLGKKFAREDTVDLRAEDIVFIKNEIERDVANGTGFLTTLGAGQIIEVLDSKEEITRPSAVAGKVSGEQQ